ncbi:MAG: HTTM domain-containing protein [Planctomycetota bacterium]
MNDAGQPTGWARRLNAPVDAASLAFFRIAFGVIMVWEVLRFFLAGWVDSHYKEPRFLFTYWPFDFVRPWPGWGLEAHFVVLALAALCVAIGFRYRLAAAVVFLSITYIFLLDKTRYLNHIYLVCLISFLMILVPAPRIWSVDARRRGGASDATVPAWTIALLRFQVGVPYFFGGVAKLNYDWLHGEPLRDWLAGRTDFPLIGPLFTREPVVWAATYGSLLLDLFVPFLLLSARTRVPAFLAAALFHVMNSRLFGIGIFPWAMIAMTTIFFPPDWPRSVAAAFRERRFGGGVFGFACGASLVIWLLDLSIVGPVPVLLAGVAGLLVGHYTQLALGGSAQGEPLLAADRAGSPLSKGALALLAGWAGAQILIPLRHYVIPGHVHWTEEGHRYAWHMKLRDKDSRSRFRVRDKATGRDYSVRLRDFLTSKQISKMSSRPDMVVQFAHHLEERFRERGVEEVEVYAQVAVSLNGREPELLLDQDRDLTEIRIPWRPPADWIYPLTEPLFPEGEEER